MSDEEFEVPSDVSSTESSDDDDLELLVDQRIIKNQNYAGDIFFNCII